MIDDTLAKYYIISNAFIHFKSILNTLYYLLTIFLHVVLKYKKYRFESREIRSKIISNLYDYYAYNYDDNNEPDGYIVHKCIIPDYIMFSEEDGYIGYIFCNESTFKTLTTNKEKDEFFLNDNYIPTKVNEQQEQSENEETENETNKLLNISKQKLTYISQHGALGHGFLSKRDICLEQDEELVFYDYQKNLFQSIMEFYQKHSYCKVFISGSPGQGKSYFNYIMAQKLNCYLCDNFDPTEAGSSISYLYNKVNPKSTKPLIIVLDEVDILIEKIHRKQIEPHKKLKLEIHDKITWNNFLDKFNYNLYPHVIIVLISNKSRQEIDAMDKSFLRSGRIDIYEKW
jgi:hypothetical protein